MLLLLTLQQQEHVQPFNVNSISFIKSKQALTQRETDSATSKLQSKRSKRND